MTNYGFYIVENINTPNEKIQSELSLSEAIIKFKESKVVNKILGVTKDGSYSCDLIWKTPERFWLSQDCTKMDNFKNDSFILLNTVSILKRELEL